MYTLSWSREESLLSRARSIGAYHWYNVAYLASYYVVLYLIGGILAARKGAINVGS